MRITSTKLSFVLLAFGLGTIANAHDFYLAGPGQVANSGGPVFILGQAIAVSRSTNYFVAGKKVSAQRFFSEISAGSFVYVSGTDSSDRLEAENLLLVDNQYVAGATTVFLSGTVSKLNRANGLARVGTVDIDVNNVSPAVLARLNVGDFIELAGTQPQAQLPVLVSSKFNIENDFDQTGISGSNASTQGISGSGLATQGISGSGFSAQGISGSGIATQGISGSGNKTQGISGSGASAQGISGSGVRTQGISGSGIATQGISGSGTSTQGISGSGVSTQGISGSGAATQGISGSGTKTQGISGSGTSAQGISGSGVSAQGISGSGTKTQGISGSGMNAQGISGSGGVNAQGISGSGKASLGISGSG